MGVQVLCGLALLTCLGFSNAAIPVDASLYFSSMLETEEQVPRDEKTYLFAVDGLKAPYSYVDGTGNLVGFDVDLIKAVCKIAKKKCSMVLQEFTECAFTHRDLNMPGNGLMAGWFDACPGYSITKDRLSTFDFSDPYLQTSASFAVAPGNPFNFNPGADDYSGFVLCHLTGAPTNAACLRRLNKRFDKIVIAKDLPEAKALLLNRTVQVVFSPRNTVDGLEILPTRVHCDQGGAGVMVKKGSTLPLWWNPAFKSVVGSGTYQDLCDEAPVKYGRQVKCLPGPSPLWH